MLRIETNMDVVVNKIDKAMSDLDIDRMTRLQASTLLALMRKRIHTEGLASDGRPIGKYSTYYFSKVRPKYGRKEGDKVVLSLTRSMEQGMILFPIAKGTAIGYATPELFQRAKWQEKRPAYGSRAIFSPTESERLIVEEIGRNYIKEVFGQL
jgi:hypothetical protein